jgi:uncharacterized membrane protein YdjX (TVP38/TMEM64 family)
MSVKTKLKKNRRLIFLLLLAGVLVALLTLDPVHAAINQALEWVKGIIRHYEALGLILFVILSAASAVFFFFSTAVIVPVAVYTWGKPATMLLLWASWLLGAAASYWIGRRPGRRLAKWIVPARRVSKYEKKILAHANFSLVLLFQVAVPSEIPGYVLGALRYSFGRYLGARAIAEIPFAIGAVYLGDSLVRRQYIPLMAIAVLGAIFSVTALYFLHKRIGASS